MRCAHPLLAVAAALCLAAAGHGHAQSEPRPGHIRAQIEVPNDVRVFTEAAEEEFAPPGTNYVDLPAVVVPIVERERLVAYAFITVRLHLASNANEWRVREQAHFLMHELVRTSHETPFARTGLASFDSEPTRALWEERLAQRLTRDRMERLEILGGDMRLLRG